MEAIKTPTRPFALLLLFTLSFAALFYIFFTFPPETSISILNLSISTLIIFFVLLFLCIYALAAFVLNSALQGILIAALVNCFLLFRLFNLTNLFFTVLLVIFFISVEGVLWKKK